MKKIKQMRIKAILLTIVAVLTLGFTSCTDELATDQTQGKPGYLTLNVKTLKTKQTKMLGAFVDDYKQLQNLNIFVFDGGVLVAKQYLTTGLNSTGLTVTTSIRVGTLSPTAKVVAIANYGDMSDVTSEATLLTKTVSTVGNFTSTGLVMTGEKVITAVDALTYSADVKVAPVTSKINVAWTLGADVTAAGYNVTGVYIVNAIDNTLLPIIQANNVITSLITPASKTVSTGLATTNARDYDIYHANAIVNPNLLDENTSGLVSPLTYYVGENLHKTIPATTGGGTLYTTDVLNTANIANTIIVIKVTHATLSPRYYTFDLNSSIANNAGDWTYTNYVTSPVWSDLVGGFSTKRKTQYNVNFTLNNLGTVNPFERLRTLNVTVQALGWEDTGSTPVIF